MFTGFGYVVLFVEAAQQFLEHRTHRIVVEAGENDFAVIVLDGLYREIDGAVGELLGNGFLFFLKSRLTCVEAG